MNEAQKEAIANADSYLNNVCLPTYGQLVWALQRIEWINGSTGGVYSMLAEFKHIASTALGPLSIK